ncbi:MAG: family 20 glycosylhydrolase, partial [Acidobacteriota bacterium]
YRGMHLDVSRHFFSVEFVKKYIDLMSQYKFNTFHWHLTDDQGWRIEIKKYPRLTEIGSKRPESVKGRELNPYVGDGVPVEGFYTQEQIKDVVAYAKARYITVIPEIELPGHSSAALAAYPELSCKPDQKYKVQTTWGIFKEVYCPTEKTFAFLEDVLSETIALFPDSPYIHIGGDEVLKDMWKESPEVKELMARENLKDVNEVQSYFVRRMEKFINSKGKKIIGWDEILEGGLAPNATVMSWRGIKGGIEAAKAHHDVIMTPTDYLYFDYAQGDPASEPLNIGGYVPLEKVYSYDPIPKELALDEAKYILGAQANIWTEYIPNEKQLEYMAFPRMLALAEVNWTSPENKNFADFQRRLAVNLPRLDAQNVNYRIPEPAGLRNVILKPDERAAVDLGSPVAGAKIYFTIDGTSPTEQSKLYEKSVDLAVQKDGRVDLKTIVVLPNGRKSAVYTATYLRRDPLPAAPAIAEKRSGLTYGFSMLSPGEGNPVITSGETRAIGLQQFAKLYDLKQAFSLSFDGYLNIPADGLYEFQVESAADAALSIDGIEVVNRWRSKDTPVSQNVLPLMAGLHKIGIRFASGGAVAAPVFRVRWAIKGQNWRNFGGGDLVH